MRLLPGCADAVPRCYIILVLAAQLRQRPFVEHRQDLDAGELCTGLGFQGFLADGLLAAAWVLPPSTSVVSVRPEYVFAYDPLGMLLGSYRRAALAAPKEADEDVLATLLRPRDSFPSQEHLNLPELFLGDHRPVGALVNLASIAERPEVEGVGEDAVQGCA